MFAGGREEGGGGREGGGGGGHLWIARGQTHGTTNSFFLLNRLLDQPFVQQSHL